MCVGTKKAQAEGARSIRTEDPVVVGALVPVLRQRAQKRGASSVDKQAIRTDKSPQHQRSSRQLRQEFQVSAAFVNLRRISRISVFSENRNERENSRWKKETGLVERKPWQWRRILSSCQALGILDRPLLRCGTAHQACVLFITPWTRTGSPRLANLPLQMYPSVYLLSVCICTLLIHYRYVYTHKCIPDELFSM